VGGIPEKGLEGSKSRTCRKALTKLKNRGTPFPKVEGEGGGFQKRRTYLGSRSDKKGIVHRGESF